MSGAPPILGYVNPAAVANDDTLVLHPPPLAWRLTILATEMIVTIGGILAGVMLANYYFSFEFTTRDRDDLAGLACCLLVVVCFAWLVRCVILVVRLKRMGQTPCTLSVDGELLTVDWPMQWGTTPRIFPRTAIHAYRLGGLGIRKLFIFSRTTTLLTIPFVPHVANTEQVRARLREMLGPELE